MVAQNFVKQHFPTIFDNACIGIIITDADGTIKAANKYVHTEFGYNEGELLNHKVEILVPKRLREKHEGLRAEFNRNPANISIAPERNLKGVKKDSREFPVEMSLGFYKDNDKTCIIVFINDLSKTEQAEDTIKQLNAELDQKVKENTRSLYATVEQLSQHIKENERKDEELVKALEKEKELNALKSRFVSVASHEFRTPLSGILASTYLLAKYTRGDEQQQREKHIKRIISSVNLLNEVLGDFLSVDKMEQGNFKPNLTTFNISDAVNELTQNMRHLLKKGQSISYKHSGRNEIAYLDHSMFQHILTNLLSNAIKYSGENSRIDVAIEHKGQKLILRVKDHGIGIPEKDQDNLYKRFFRGSNATHIEGTGLGLNIVKKYVDILDGTIAYNSVVNKGTEFIITFNNQKERYEDNTGS
jgi:PAS domain S-box-containing protein